MKAIVYIQVNEDDIIDDFSLFQIYLKLYKAKETDKELAIFKVNYITEHLYAFSITSRIKMENKSDNLVTDIIKVPVDSEEDLMKEINIYLESNKDKYEFVLLISNISQTRLFSNHITSLFSITTESIYPELI